MIHFQEFRNEEKKVSLLLRGLTNLVKKYYFNKILHCEFIIKPVFVQGNSQKTMSNTVIIPHSIKLFPMNYSWVLCFHENIQYTSKSIVNLCVLAELGSKDIEV